MSKKARTRRREPEPHPDPVTITGVAEGGKGVARIDGKTVFVKGAMLGEVVMIEFIKRRPSYDDARVTEVVEASQYRQSPPCEFFSNCGGCSLQHQTSAGQIIDKQSILLEQLTHIGKVTPEAVVEPLQGPAWGYRGKARLGVRYVKAKQRVLVGFREKQQRGIAEMDSCQVLDSRVSALLPPLAAMIEQLAVREKIPQIEVAVDDSVVVLIIRHMELLTSEDRDLIRSFGDQHQARIMLQPAGLDSVHPLPPDSADPLSYQLPDYQLTIEFYPLQFTQVNNEMNRQMIAQALRWLDVKGDDRVADLFCGVGNFTLPLARHAAQVVGVEGEAELVKQATRNATLNNISNVEFRVEDLFEEIGSSLGHFDKLLLDPPRSGAQLICENIERFQASRIVYVSCNPATLARDAAVLVGRKGYRLVRTGVIDMFPHTSHVESMALFELTE